MFDIPLEHDTNLLTQDQKSILCKSITEYVEYYISDNRLSQKLRPNIGIPVLLSA